MVKVFRRSTMERFKQRCLGEPVKLDQDEIKEANRQIKNKLKVNGDFLREKSLKV